MAGYTRQDVSDNISNGSIIDADDLDNEFNALETAFNAASGHTHDGTTGNGAPITKLGPSQDVVVSTTSVTPKTTNTVDIGNASLKFKDMYLSGSILDADINLSNVTVTGTVAQFNTALSDGNFATLAGTETLTNKTIDSATNTITVDLTEATVTGTLAEFNTALSDATFATTAGAETLTNKTLDLTSNTLTGTVAQFNTALSDDNFVTLTGTETLSNKTLIEPNISLIVNTGTLTLPTSTDTLVGRATTDTLTNKTIDSATNTVTVDLSEATVTGTTAEFNAALSDGSFATLAGTETLTNKTLTSPTINTGDLTNPTVTNYVETLNTSSGATYTVDLANGTLHKFTTTANATITLPASVAGKSFVVIVAYGGAHTLTFSGGGTIKWTGGSQPTATSAGGAFDVFTFIQDGTNTYGTTYGLNF